MDTTSKLQIQFPYMGLDKAIIAMKGLPCTGKSEIAREIGRWARCQVCYIDDFLEAFSLERGYTTESPPSGDEADRLHHLAFDALCRAALRHLRLSDCVVIKSRLCSTFELDRLIRLVNDINGFEDARIVVVIIECQIKNEFRWQTRLRLSERVQEYVWYKARKWKDIEKAMDDEYCLDSKAWDLQLLSSLNANPAFFPRRITRLVLDPFSDLNAPHYLHTIPLTLDFLDAMKHLLINQDDYLADLDEDQDDPFEGVYKGGYKALQFDELRRDLLEMELRTSRGRGKYLCTPNTTKVGSCVFKYSLVLPAACDAEGSCCCRLCGVRVGSGQLAYTCHFCVLTLHTSCAVKLDFDFRNHKHDSQSSLSFHIRSYRYGFSEGQEERYACKSCMEGGKNFSSRCESCLFETHLKGGMLPTIINHDCHPLHFLSIRFTYKENSCKACGMSIWELGGYVCHICNFFYHMECVFLPGEVKHAHGGYQHAIKLLYSHDATEPEDDHWCNVCYKDMDPQAWFYSCQNCPYYGTHAYTGCTGYESIDEAINNSNIPIQQIRDKLKVDETG